MDDDSSGRSAKVTKLLPKGLTAKGRWRKQPSKESFASTASSEDTPRGRSPHSREALHGDGLSERFSTSQSQSQSDHLLERDEQEDDDTNNVSPMIDESDPYVSPVRPTVLSTPHPSQIGHLTTSSPIIQADHAPEVQIIDELANADPDSLSRSTTYSVSVSSTSSNEPVRQLSVSKTGLQPPLGVAARRSKSPGGKFRDVFKSKKNTSSTPNLGSQPSTGTDQTDFAVEDTSRPASSSALDSNDAEVASLERRRKKTQPSIDTSRRPRTPPSHAAAPVIVNTPPTPTDYSHPDRAPGAGPPVNPTVTVSPPSSMVNHRRARSGSATSIGPSKLANITLPPLTPTPENGPPSTPGGTSFFSSMFSAAQNASNTLSNTVSTSIGLNNKPKTPIPAESQEGDGDTTEVETSTGQLGETTMGEPAVKTLGQGDLSLSHLGIQDNGSAAATPQSSKFPDHLADTRSRSESAPDAPQIQSSQSGLTSDDLGDRPRSLYESVGDRTPPVSVYEGKAGVHRSGSIRSAIGRRRKRGSTGGTAGTSGTATTIGAAIAAANASVAHPNAAGSVPKLTGFAVASKKRNRDFHTLFKSVPDDDYLIEDYSCALQREILAHGRLYVSEGHLCFSSNILGWVTTLVMSFDEIVSVEKRSTALLFKNGLMISTLHAKHVFASFTSRDSTYDLIVNIWKLGHPTLRSSLNGVTLEETGGDKTEKVTDLDPPADHSGSGSEIGDEDDSGNGSEDIYDEDEEEEGSVDFTNAAEASLTDAEAEKAAARKPSGALTTNGVSEKPSAGALTPAGATDFPGPPTHAPTECGDIASHYERPLGDEVIPAPLGKVYNLIFGPASTNFMGKWLTNEQKCTDLQMEDKTGLTQDNKSRGYSYIKPLNASIGPRQTKCVVNETVEGLDLEKAVNVLVVTQTPDVPSGNVFSVKTKYCLSWAENNATRVQVNCTIEWTGKSWIKGPIEKGANDGQIQYCKDLFATIKAAISTRPAAVNGTALKGRRKKGKKLNETSRESFNAVSQPTAKKTQDWGALEPLHGILGPVVDIVKPILTGNVVYGLLVGLLVASWFGFGFNPRHNAGGYGSGIGFPGHPDRLIAYEEVWRHEESDLWDWLEERVGLHRMHDGAVPTRKRVVEPRAVEDKLREEKMTEREVEEAIRVTEEKLRVLREVHHRRNPKTFGHTRPTTRPETDR
ncbi:GRAM domain-containing protein [Seiridium cupressi]